MIDSKKSVIFKLVINVVVFIGIFLPLYLLFFDFSPVTKVSNSLSEILGIDNKLTWSWNSRLEHAESISFFELQKALNYLYPEADIEIDGEQWNQKQWDYVKLSKQLAFEEEYKDLEGAWYCQKTQDTKLFEEYYFVFLTEVLKIKFSEFE